MSFRRDREQSDEVSSSDGSSWERDFDSDSDSENYEEEDDLWNTYVNPERYDAFQQEQNLFHVSRNQELPNASPTRRIRHPTRFYSLAREQVEREPEECNNILQYVDRYSQDFVVNRLYPLPEGQRKLLLSKDLGVFFFCSTGSKKYFPVHRVIQIFDKNSQYNRKKRLSDPNFEIPSLYFENNPSKKLSQEQIQDLVTLKRKWRKRKTLPKTE